MERVERAGVVEQLGETSEVEKILVGQADELIEHRGEAVVGVLDDGVVQQRGLDAVQPQPASQVA